MSARPERLYWNLLHDASAISLLPLLKICVQVVPLVDTSTVAYAKGW